MTINGGDFEISSGDDGIHADYDLEINDGNINIAKTINRWHFLRLISKKVRVMKFIPGKIT
ncbi:MAG: carbohydrate-binding domain-containing protein [Draconibacterium sp.]